ncbi:WD repeat-containing protein 86 isoform X3 [Bubalus bubalis]|uniref:WD repeat-containing protein 86 isoform X3 n=1 Tax=Bubalus bubalis TaxID=89462 RepID=UPI001D0FF11E|nr:WD repeat-containing protein 86 isoform X3 [Bubalus bubalis]
MGGGGSALRVCADHRGGINWLSLSPDGQRLLTGSEDGTARLWSTADGTCCALLQGHESYVTFCQLEDEAAFTCSADCTIRKWDVLTGQCLQVFRGHTSIVNRILVADNQLFSSSYDRTARAWSVDRGQVAREFRGHRNCVLTLAYAGAPCVEEAVAGGLLVTGSTDATAKVWQVASGCCHQTLRGHTGAVLCLVLDAPGRTAFTGSTDATVRAWDILSGQQLRVFREHQGSVICLESFPASGSFPVRWLFASGGQSIGVSASVLPINVQAGKPARVLGQRRQDGQVLAGRHRRARAHVHGPQTQRERPQVPRGHLTGQADPKPKGGGPPQPCRAGCGPHGAPGSPAPHADLEGVVLKIVKCSPAAGTPARAPSTPSPERCGGCSAATPSSSTASRAGRVQASPEPREEPGGGGGAPPAAGRPLPAPAGARPSALHRLARRRAAPLGRSRPPAAARRRPQAQPLATLQQQAPPLVPSPHPWCPPGLAPAGRCCRKRKCCRRQSPPLKAEKLK